MRVTGLRLHLLETCHDRVCVGMVAVAAAAAGGRVLHPHECPARMEVLGFQVGREVVSLVQRDGALDMERGHQRLGTNGLPNCERYSRVRFGFLD